jgi:two-component system, NtrC family, sensor kinase
MRLVRRLTLYLLLAMGVVLGIDTFLSVRSHLALFDEDVRRDEKVLGAALGRVVERIWQQHGEHEATALVEAMDAAAPEVRVRIVRLDAERRRNAAPSVRRRALEAIRRDRTLTHVREEGEPDARLLTYVPLEVPGDRPVALEVSESLAHERTYTFARVRGTLLTGALAALACGVVAWGVGTRVVGRPVDALVAKARRIARRDFSEPLVMPARDELSQLAHEMNAMADRLAAARGRIDDETAARLAAVDQLRHADRLSTAGKLASGIAHELGTPLHVISERARMIASGEAREPGEARACAEVIHQQASRMTHIVRQLLDSRAAADPETGTTDLVGARALHAGAADAAGGEARRRRSCWRRRDAGSPPRWTPARSSRRSPTSCSTRSTQHAGVAAASRCAVEAGGAGRRRAHRGGATTGPGIEEELLRCIFDPFFTTKPVGEGTGLGLSIADGIAHEHGGRIEVDSAPGAGSRFAICVPIGGAR